MSYLGELRDNIRPLAAASLGGGTSLPLFAYTSSVFAPYLVRDFGWSRAQFALVGLTMLSTLFLLPFIGRFADLLGVRRVALIGTLLMPLCFVAFAMQTGSFAYFLVVTVSLLAIGSLTSPLVYSRLIAENFERATGLALTVVNCVPALLAIGLVPLLNWCIATYGWRSSYLGLGALALVAGLIAVSLIPRQQGKRERAELVAELAGDAPVEGGGAVPAIPHGAGQDYSVILRSRTFWIIIIGMFLCLLQTPLHASQMNLMLIDNRMSPQAAAYVVSIYAFGTLLGRVACGLALDRFPTPIVTCLSMILPALGFFLLASDFDTVGVITFAMFLVGLSVGAESDLLSFLIARYFKLRIYGTTFGLLACATFLASAVGALGISLTLALSNSFAPYLTIVSVTVLLGSVLFLALPGARDTEKVG